MHFPAYHPDSPRITRFAPSPTGYLHLGHVVHALYVWGVAQNIGAKVLLRIEDHDRIRCKPQYDAALLDDIEWLGLKPDQPTSAALRVAGSGFRQSECNAVYEAALEKLKQMAHVYACDCSRRTLQNRTGELGEELAYDGYCRNRNLPFDKGLSLRVEMPVETFSFDDLTLGHCSQTPASQCGDLLLRDNHGHWTYQFCVVVDDLRHGVNLIIRGVDILESTGRQLQLAKMLGRKDTPVFLHHPLLVDASGRKLSKRDFDAEIHTSFLEGMRAEKIIGMAAHAAGWIGQEQDLSLSEALQLAVQNLKS